jgi:hypothetical protein
MHYFKSQFVPVGELLDNFRMQQTPHAGPVDLQSTLRG